MSLVPLLVTTSGAAPQTKKIPVTKNSLRKLVTEKPSEVIHGLAQDQGIRQCFIFR